jgi:hypothetical protein
LEKAVCDVIAEGVDVTYDLKGTKEGAVGTQEMAAAICKNPFKNGRFRGDVREEMQQRV